MAPKRAVKAKAVTPPAVADKPALTARLEELGDLLKNGMISQVEHDDGRAAALGITTKNPTTASLENSESKSRRELLALIQKWIGGKDSPCLAGDLHDAVVVGTGDEGLRQQIALLTTESRLAIELAATFKAAAKGTVPPAFAGATNEALRFSRLAARGFLQGLAAALAVSQANKLEELEWEERKTLWKETLLLIDDDDSAANSSTVLANLKVHRATKAVAKRLREEEGETTPKNTPKGRSSARAQSQTPKKDERTLSEKERAQHKKSKLCFKCHKPGHQANQCPKK